MGSLIFKWRGKIFNLMCEYPVLKPQRFSGSLLKLLYKELLGFTVAFVTISLIYRHALSEDQKQ